jgi:hypothetical protein
MAEVGVFPLVLLQRDVVVVLGRDLLPGPQELLEALG